MINDFGVCSMLAELPMTIRLVAVSILSVLGWELMKHVLKDLVASNYYHRESEDVVIKVKLMPWDRTGMEHFEGQGYTREFPESEMQKGILDKFQNKKKKMAAGS